MHQWTPPEEPADADQPATYYVCGQCHAPPNIIDLDEGLWTANCPTHGTIAYGQTGPHLDLGITRESAPN